MSLVKSPRMNPAKLAANRANAQKSTGPRTWRGKGRVALNALKHGRYASPRLFRTRIARSREELALYDWIHQQICERLGPHNPQQRQEAEDLARDVWCYFRARPGDRTGGTGCSGPGDRAAASRNRQPATGNREPTTEHESFQFTA